MYGEAKETKLGLLRLGVSDFYGIDEIKKSFTRRVNYTRLMTVLHPFIHSLQQHMQTLC